MSIREDVTRKATQVPLALLRVIETRVVAPVVRDGSPVRRAVAKGLSSFGHASEDVRDETPSAAPSEPVVAPDGARDETSPAPTEPAATPDVEQQIEELAEHHLAEQQPQTFVGELADDEIRRAQAEVWAKQHVADPSA